MIIWGDNKADKAWARMANSKEGREMMRFSGFVCALIFACLLFLGGVWALGYSASHQEVSKIRVDISDVLETKFNEVRK